MSLRPGLVVEVAFGTNPNDSAAVAAMTSASWTDISGWVRGASFDRPKRTAELDRFEAGTAKLVLDNTDGQFSPTNTSSPHAGQLVPYRMIRIRALWAGTYYPLWQGYVERWPASWVDPAQGMTVLECVDAMAVAAQIGMTSFYTAEVLADAPLYYYPLTDDSTATAAANQSTTAQQNAVIFHNNIAAQSETYAFGSTLPIPGAEQQGLQFTRGSGGSAGFPGYALRLPFVQLPWATGWTIEFWASLAAGDDGCLLYIQDQAAAQNVPFIQLFVSFSGVETVTVRPPGSASYSAYTIGTTENVADGIPRHYVISFDGAKLQFYRNGNDEGWIAMASGSASNTPSLIQIGSTDTVGAAVTVKNSEGSPGVLAGTVGQLAIYPRVLTAARVRTHYNIGWLGLAGQITGQRAGSLLTYADWPSAFSLVYNGSTTFQAATNITNRSLLECLQDVADTEQSELFVLPDGRLCLTYRGQRMDQYAPAVTFGSNIPAGEIPVSLPSLQLDYDPTLVYNDVSIARNGASTARVYDAASILAYFTRSFSRTSYADNDQDARNAAAWLLDRYAQPQLRAETITIAAAGMGPDVANFWPTILGLDLSDRVLLNHEPMGSAPLIALPGFLDQLSHSIDPDAGTWTVTIQISPLFHQYFALASDTDPTWDAASTPDANGYIYLSY